MMMLYDARSAAPKDSLNLYHHPIIDQAAEGKITLFTAPPGYLLADYLAAALRAHGQPTIWLRIDPGDRDPATLLLSLMQATQRVTPDLGRSTLEEMLKRPGPIFGWPPLFASLAQEMASALPEASALVLEHVHNLDIAQPSLQLLLNDLLPFLPERFNRILISDRKLPSSAIPEKTVIRGVEDMRIDFRSGRELARSSGTDLSKDSVERAIHLTGGRVVALTGLYSASNILGPDFIQQAIKRSRDFIDLLAKIAGAFFSSAEVNALQALSLTTRLEYSHPNLSIAATGSQSVLEGPWLQPLSEGWVRLRRIWQAPLQVALRPGARAKPVALHRAANYLDQHGATSEALRLYLELGDIASAGQIVAGSAGKLLDLGQWDTLKDYLSWIPASAKRSWPLLVHIQGELSAAEGKTNAARRQFSEAAKLFSSLGDSAGACQSLLAESTLAAWQGDYDHAQSSALSARALADAAALFKQGGWSDWQLGSLTAASGRLDEALVHFGRAANAIGNRHIGEVLNQVENLMALQSKSHQQSAYNYKEFLRAQQAEHYAANRLRQLLNSPPENLEALLASYGWSQTPLGFKLPAPTEVEGAQRDNGLWPRLRKIFDPTPAHANPLAPDPEVDKILPVTLLASGHLPAGETALLSPTSFPNTPGLKAQVPAAEIRARLSLTGYLLGSFHVLLDARPIENWPDGHGGAVFKYILAHHGQSASREALMNLFWPNIPRAVARDNLNIAMQSLQRVFSAVTDIPLITFEDEAYCLNPDIHIWVDVDEFNRLLRASRQLEAAGQMEQAMGELEMAAGLYRGDFLEDDPSAEWPVLTRERLKNAYLYILDRLSRIYFSNKQYTACMFISQLILERNSRNENAHGLLMRCFEHLGHRNLEPGKDQKREGITSTKDSVDHRSATIQLTQGQTSGIPLLVYCLGPLCVFQGERLIENWTSRKAQAVFKYLVIHRRHPVPKELLMDVFWPEADPEAARRNLHQAIYALRQTLSADEPNFQYIQFENDCYRLNQDLDVWVDHEAFEQHYLAGMQLERSDLHEKAVIEYESAAGLYLDHFLADDLYEPWPQSRRQYLWGAYLAIADYLAKYHLQNKDFSSAITLCQKVLAWDNSLEVAHQILMQCYLLQGQRPLAIRQYHLCAQALKKELDVSPSPETIHLFQQILHGEAPD